MKLIPTIIPSILWTSVGLIGLSASSMGQITSIGAFTGTHQDGFETQDTSAGPFPPCIVDGLFTNNGGTSYVGDMCTPSGASHITGGWGFGCSMAPNGGSRLFGSTNGMAVITLTADASRFGGYFGTNNPSASDGFVSFFDSVVGGTQVGATQLITAPNNCTWTWNGWDFGGVGVRRIEISCNYSSGGYMLLDDLEVDLGPGNMNSGALGCDCSAGNPNCFNASVVGAGCPNTAGGGAILTGSGNAVVSSDTFALSVTGGVPSQFGLILSGTASIGPIYTVADSAGGLCSGGTTNRSDVYQLDGTGSKALPTFKASIGGGAYGAASGIGFQTYQFWFRDPGGAVSCTTDTAASDFNFSNGWDVTWL